MKVIISASGTGGHLIPALTIANELKFNNHPVVFIGSGRPLEDKIIKDYPKYKIKIVGVKNRGFFGKVQFLLLMPYAIFQVVKILKKEKPDYILGVGGYVSVFPIIIGKLFGIKTGIYELEKHYGMANRFLSRFSNQIFNAYQIGQYPDKENLVGLCIRSEIWNIPKLETNKINKILILGGSQGSKILDQTILELAGYFKENNLEIWHQCRAESQEWLRLGYESKGLHVKLESFIEHPEKAYNWADLIISRSGVGTINEIKVAQRPAIFIPLSYASEQIQNAKSMRELKIAKVIYEDENLAENLKRELEDRDTFLNEFKQHSGHIENENAAKKIYDLIA